MSRAPKKAAIVWLEDPRQYEYVRVSQFTSGSRSPPSERAVRESIGGGLCKLVGYGPATRVEHGLFTRDIYWLKSYDRAVARVDKAVKIAGALKVVKR